MTDERANQKIDEVIEARWRQEEYTANDHARPVVDMVQVFAGEVPKGTYFHLGNYFINPRWVIGPSTDPTMIVCRGSTGTEVIGIKTKVWTRRETPPAEPCDCEVCLSVRERAAFKAGTLRPDEELAKQLADPVGDPVPVPKANRSVVIDKERRPRRAR